MEIQKAGLISGLRRLTRWLRIFLERKVRLRILILQEHNLNRPGLRKPGVYVTQTFSGLQEEMDKKAGELGCTLAHFQSKSEGVSVDWFQKRQDEADAIICNPAGLTNYGLSLKDALAEMVKDFAITHLSNIPARGGWRRATYLPRRRISTLRG